MKAAGRQYLVSGRVQGVGYRYFVLQRASELKLAGYTRNLDDGRVEVYACGTEGNLSALSGHLRKGPRWSEVRSVEEREAPVLEYEGFHIRSR